MEIKEAVGILEHMSSLMKRTEETPTEQIEKYKNAPEYAERLRKAYEDALGTAIGFITDALEK